MRDEKRQTTSELRGRLIHVPGTVWQPLTEVQVLPNGEAERGMEQGTGAAVGRM